jgi:hypothetical protein
LAINWGNLLVDQLTFYWDVYLWPRLQGLTDDEYFWEPVAGCWTVRPSAGGRFVADWQWPPPKPEPVTTIAWRIVHVGAGCFANRASAFFGGEGVPEDATMSDPRHRPLDLPGNAADGLAFLHDSYRKWHDGIAGLDQAGLEQPLGPKGDGYSADPMAGLVLHISREAMHHGGEICLLRDLYRASGPHHRLR